MLIELGKINYMHLIFVLVPIANKIQSLINDYLELKVPNKMYLIFNEYFSMIISGITIHLLIKYCTKTQKEKENEQHHKEKTKELNALEDNRNKSLNQYQIIELDVIHKNTTETRNKILFIVLIAYIQLVGFIIEKFLINKLIEYSTPQLYKNTALFVLSLFLILFSIIFLRFRLHRHQFFALGIMLFCSITFISQSIIYKKNISFTDALLAFIRLSIFVSFYCLHDVLGKKYLNTYMDGVYLYMFKFSLLQVLHY